MPREFIQTATLIIIYHQDLKHLTENTGKWHEKRNTGHNPGMSHVVQLLSFSWPAPIPPTEPHSAVGGEGMAQQSARSTPPHHIDPLLKDLPLSSGRQVDTYSPITNDFEELLKELTEELALHCPETRTSNQTNSGRPFYSLSVVPSNDSLLGAD